MSHKLFSLVTCLVLVLNFGIVPNFAQAQDEVPTLYAEINFEWVDGWNWPNGDTVALTIKESEGGDPIYYDESVVGTHDPNLPNYVRFDVGEGEDPFDVRPGLIVSLKDLATGATKTHTVLNIGITDVDTSSNIVTGYAARDTSLNITAHTPCWQSVEVTANGPDYLEEGYAYWYADFTGLCELDTVEFINADQPGTEEDGVSTGFFWSPPPPPSEPSFSARITENQVHGYGWPLGVQVSLTVNGIGFGPETVVQADWDPNETFVWFDLGESLTLQGGQYIEMTYGDIVKTHTVTNLAVTGVDPVADTVFGTADAGTQVDVGHIYCDNNGCYGFRREETDAIGDWTADFSVVGGDDDEQDIIDIQPGMGSEARQCDDDGDCTQYGWHVPNPHFTVYPEWDSVELWEWPEGVLVTATVSDKPECHAEGDVGGSLWGTNLWMDFPEDCDVVVEDVVNLAAPDIQFSQEHIVQNLSITNVDVDTDTVSGMADPGETVYVWPHGFGEYEVQPTADGDGNWDAIFPEDLLEPGMDGRSEVRDEYGNSTAVDWHIPNPNIAIRANDDWIDGWEWPLDAIVTIEIDDPSTPADPDHTEYNVTAYVPDWDPNTTYFEVNLQGSFDIQVGFEITATDGATTKFHEVTNLSFTQIDTDTEMVHGTATPDSRIGVWVCDDAHCVNRDENVDEFGNWGADFSIPGDEDWESETFDIQFGTWVDSQEWDFDSDRTMFGMNVPPPVEGYHDYDQGDVPGFACNAGGWAMDPDDPESTVTVRILVDGTPVLTIPADGYREDLETSWNEGGGGCPGGNCAFEVSLWDYLTHYETHEILIEAQDLLSGEWYSLGESPKTLTCRTYDIYAYNPLTGTTTQITDLRDADEYNPSWSPNGRFVAHDVVKGDSHDIYITSVLTHKSTLLKGAEGGNDAAWSPNGLWIAFDRRWTDEPHLYIVPFTGGQGRLVRENAASADWSPSGLRIVFQDLADGKLKTVGLLGNLVIEVAEYGENPSWSPDGKWIAYQRDGDIWKVRVGPLGTPFGKPIQVTSGPFDDGGPTWSADSKYIIYASGISRDYDLWKVPAAGGEPTWLTGAPEFGDYDPDTSKKFIAYESFSPDGQAERVWISAFTHDLPAGTWSEGTHAYHFDADGESGAELSFSVSNEASLYDGFVLLRPFDVRARSEEVCTSIDAIHPNQQTRFHVGYLSNNVAYQEAVAFFDNLAARAVWDGGLSADLVRHEIFPWTSQIDWPAYVCTYTR